MKRVLILLVTITIPCIALSNASDVDGAMSITVPKAIYGNQDDRVEVMQADKLHQEAARSVAGLFERSSLSINPINNEWLLPRVPLLKDNGWCVSERFSEQPATAVCSGFLMAPDRLVSSAHCAKPDDADPYIDGLRCSDIAAVFDYTLESTELFDGRERALDEQQLYFCEEVVGRFVDPSGADWSVLKLDRPVIGRKPLLPFSRAHISQTMKLSVIGHPLGLPSKVATGGYVLDQSRTSYVVTDLDTYAGNSGSPVLVQAEKNADLHVLGILSRGHDDSVVAIAENGGVCEVSRLCQELTCDGEHVTRITEVPQSLLNSSFNSSRRKPEQRF